MDWTWLSITSAEFIATMYMMMDVIQVLLLTRMNKVKVYNLDYILNGSDYILNDSFEDIL